MKYKIDQTVFFLHSGIVCRALHIWDNLVIIHYIMCLATLCSRPTSAAIHVALTMKSWTTTGYLCLKLRVTLQLVTLGTAWQKKVATTLISPNRNKRVWWHSFCTCSVAWSSHKEDRGHMEHCSTFLTHRIWLKSLALKYFYFLFSILTQTLEWIIQNILSSLICWTCECHT